MSPYLPSPACFTGPLNAFEEKLIIPFGTTLPNLELMRSGLIQNFVDTDPIAATRTVFLLGQTHDLSVVLRDLVPVPTATERQARLCKRRSRLTVAAAMPSKRVWLENSIKELASLRVPQEHRQMFSTYIDSSDEAQVVLVMCFIVLLAKALE